MRRKAHVTNHTLGNPEVKLVRELSVAHSRKLIQRVDRFDEVFTRSHSPRADSSREIALVEQGEHSQDSHSSWIVETVKSTPFDTNQTNKRF